MRKTGWIKRWVRNLVTIGFLLILGVALGKEGQTTGLSSENLLLNPSFEIDEDKDGLPDNWNFMLHLGEMPNALDTEVHHSGKWSLRCVATERSKGDWSNWYKQIKVKNGEKIEAGVYIKTANLDGEVHLVVGFHNPNPSQKLTWIGGALESKKLSGDNDWIFLKVDGTVPPEAEVASFHLCFLGEGTVWFDDTSFTKAGKVQDGTMQSEAEKTPEKKDAKLAEDDLSKTQESINKISEINITPALYPGRMAIFYEDIAKTYYDYVKARLDKEKPEDEVDDLIRYSNYALEYSLKALKEAEKPESTHPMQKAEASPDASKFTTGRESICLNGEWFFYPGGTPDALPLSGWRSIQVPHGPWSQAIGEFINLDMDWDRDSHPRGYCPFHSAWYKLDFSVPDDWPGKRIKIAFGGVFHYTEVFVNGRYIDNHCGGYSSFEVDITEAVNPGKKNTLLLYVEDTTMTRTSPPYRYSEDGPIASAGQNLYMVSDRWGHSYGGIWQDVFLNAYPKVYVEDTFIITSVREKKITIKVWVKNEDIEAHEVELINKVLRKGQIEFAIKPISVNLKPKEVKMTEISSEWVNPQLWGIGGEYGNPVLYFLSTSLVKNGKKIDEKFTRFGFREFWIEGTDFYLNGKKIYLQGDAMWTMCEEKLSQANRWWAQRFFKAERGANINLIRNIWGDFNEDRYDVADELGMLCELGSPYDNGNYDVIPNSDYNDPVWVKNLERDTRNWIKKFRNHPSIVLWESEGEFASSTKPPWGTPKCLDRFFSRDEIIREEDGTRPIDHHGNQARYADKRYEIVNFHYMGATSADNWQTKTEGRPLIIGEFHDVQAKEMIRAYEDNLKTREIGQKGTRYMAKSYASEIKYYVDRNVSGIYPFTLWDYGCYSNGWAEKMGPWGDVFKPLSEYHGWTREWIPVTWPSLSGRGIKTERVWTWFNGTLINWFDPTHPEYVTNEVYDAVRKAFRPIPALNLKIPPEVIIRVVKNGEPVVGINVFLEPLQEQAINPIGVLTDKNGTAWFVLKEEGKYKSYCSNSRSNRGSIIIETKSGTLEAKPGFGNIQRVELILE